MVFFGMVWQQRQTAPNNGWSARASHGHPAGFGFFGA